MTTEHKPQNSQDELVPIRPKRGEIVRAYDGRLGGVIKSRQDEALIRWDGKIDAVWIPWERVASEVERVARMRAQEGLS